MIDKNFYIKNGWINLYKPSGITSSACTYKIRKILTVYFQNKGILPAKEKLVCGHMGTLDPMAEGIIPIAIGEATKTIPYHERGMKKYIFTVKWGQGTDTDDATGNIVNHSNKIPTDPEIKNIIPFFIGNINQTPSRFSAVHINGRRAYDLARNGEDFEMPQRTVLIKSLTLDKSWTDNKTEGISSFSKFTVDCGTGTYIRTLAYDISKKLGTFGYLTELIRTRNGHFHHLDSIKFEKFLDFFEKLSENKPASEIGKTDSYAKDVRIEEFLKPIDYKLDDIPVMVIDPSDTKKFSKGVSFNSDYQNGFYKMYSHCDSDFANKSENIFVGFAEINNGTLQPKRVMNFFKKE